MTELERRKHKVEEHRKRRNAIKLYIAEYKEYGMTNAEIADVLGLSEEYVLWAMTTK